MNTPYPSKLSAGRILLTILGLFTAISPYLADWNETHIYNPAWPPHAKFHNAQTMVLGAMLGLVTLYCTWFRNAVSLRQSLNESVCIVSLYWLSQLPAILFPGTMLTDPTGNHLQPPLILGIEFNQLTMDIFLVLPLIAVSYFLESKRIKRLE
ncbi:MAG: acetyltransferase [Cyclobacteriaceae bacterium]|nr:acetyltransferase [Cyclobacteriaceae bacterium]